MNTHAPRPGGVVFVAVLLILCGVLGIIGGAMSIIAGSQHTSTAVEGVELNGTGLMALGIFFIASGVLNLHFAFGILRGSRVARMIITILQVLSIAAGVWGLFSGGGIFQSIHGILFPLVIIVGLWSGVGTRQFFSR